MERYELIELLHDFEAVYRSGMQIQPEITAEMFRLAANWIEGTPTRSARASDPGTSRKASENVKLRSGSQRAKLLKAYAEAEWGLTDEQAGQASGLADKGACWWKRCSELRQADLIRFTGGTRMASSGEQQMVCSITDAGKVMLNGLATVREMRRV